MSDRFEWSLIESFLAIARAGRLTAAAGKLGIDHTTLSRRIKQLETALDARLFERSVTGYQLTPQGEQFLTAAQRIETIVLQARQEISGETAKIGGTVRIGATEGFGTCFLAPRLVRLRKIQSDLAVELVTMPRLFSLSKREADLAIGLARPATGRVYAHKLTDYELGLYAAKSYLDTVGQPVKMHDLRDHQMVGYVPDLVYAKELDYAPLVLKDTPRQMTSSNVVAQLQMTVAGGGLCILPKFMADGDPRLVRVLPDSVRILRSFWFIVHADLRDLARIRFCSDFLTEEIRSARTVFLS